MHITLTLPILSVSLPLNGRVIKATKAKTGITNQVYCCALILLNSKSISGITILKLQKNSKQAKQSFQNWEEYI